MVVKIRTLSRKPELQAGVRTSNGKRGPAGDAFDRRVHEIAPTIIAQQKQGCVSGRQLEASFAADGILNWKCRRWDHRTLYRVLKRGKELGLAFILRTRSQAAMERKPDYRTPTEKRAGREALFAEYLAKNPSMQAEFDAVPIASVSANSLSGSGNAPL